MFYVSDTWTPIDMDNFDILSKKLQIIRYISFWTFYFKATLKAFADVHNQDSESVGEAHK